MKNIEIKITDKDTGESIKASISEDRCLLHKLSLEEYTKKISSLLLCELYRENT